MILRATNSTRNMVCAAICLALCMVLPFLTGQIPEIGGMLCPMHIPVLLAGFLCGPWWAMCVGFTAPALRYLFFGMPPLLPVGVPMMFELMVYGLAAGGLHRKFRSIRGKVYWALGGAMLAGRIVWGIVAAAVYGGLEKPFTWSIFLSSAFVNAVPGIVVQIVLIPVLVFALQKAKVISI